MNFIKSRSNSNMIYLWGTFSKYYSHFLSIQTEVNIWKGKFSDKLILLYKHPCASFDDLFLHSNWKTLEEITSIPKTLQHFTKSKNLFSSSPNFVTWSISMNINVIEIKTVEMRAKTVRWVKYELSGFLCNTLYLECIQISSLINITFIF